MNTEFQLFVRWICLSQAVVLETGLCKDAGTKVSDFPISSIWFPSFPAFQSKVNWFVNPKSWFPDGTYDFFFKIGFLVNLHVDWSGHVMFYMLLCMVQPLQLMTHLWLQWLCLKKVEKQTGLLDFTKVPRILNGSRPRTKLLEESGCKQHWAIVHLIVYSCVSPVKCQNVMQEKGLFDLSQGDIAASLFFLCPQGTIVPFTG